MMPVSSLASSLSYSETCAPPLPGVVRVRHLFGDPRHDAVHVTLARLGDSLVNDLLWVQGDWLKALQRSGHE